MKQWMIVCALAALWYGLSCTEASCESAAEAVTPSQANPNGDSELALLMRQMFEEGQRMKEQVRKGEKVTVSVDYARIHTAQATQPEKAASDEYRAFALSYEATMDAIREAPPAEAAELYDGMVQACMNCHQALCPGPTVRIKKLALQ